MVTAPQAAIASSEPTIIITLGATACSHVHSSKEQTMWHHLVPTEWPEAAGLSVMCSHPASGVEQ